MPLRMTPARFSVGSNALKPRAMAPTLREALEASTTSTTGRPSSLASWAVLPASSSPVAPSYSPHHALDDGDILADHGTLKQLLDRLGGEEPAIEVPARHTTDGTMVGGVDIVRTDLERLDL